MATATLEKNKTQIAPTESHTLPKNRFEEIFQEMENFWDRAFPFRTEIFRKMPELRMRDLGWAPRIDVFEKEGELIVHADLPGMKKEEIEILFEEGDLVLKGEHKLEEEKKGKEYYRSERFHGAFFRRIPLGFEIDPKLVKATFTNGVLELGIPIPPKSLPEPKRITIR
jgi:HSP20 family protein